MTRPGGANHHHASRWRANPFCAKYSIVPSVEEWEAPRPRKDSPASLRMAEITAKTNCEASTGSRLGRISTQITRQGLSPATRAAAT
jgi:hypothetical protein